MGAHAGGRGGSVPFVGTDPPTNPSDGALWWDPDDDTAVPGSLASVTRVLLVAEVLALHTSPVELVPAVLGKMTVPLHLIAVVEDGTTPYNLAGDAQVQWGDSGTLNPASVTGLSTALGFASASFDTQIGNEAVSGLTASVLVGHPILLLVDVADPTDGTGTVEVTVVYMVA